MPISNYYEVEITSSGDLIKFTPQEYNIRYTSMVAPDSGRVIKDAEMKIPEWYARCIPKLTLKLPPHLKDDILYSRIASYVMGQEVLVSFYDYISHENKTNVPMYCSEISAGYSYRGLITDVSIELIGMKGTTSVPHIKSNYTITTVASPAGGGSVSGGGTYIKNATATLTAIANAGYSFTKWSDNVLTNPRTVTVTADSTYTAIFTADPVYYNVTATVIPGGSGSVSGLGSYLSGSTCTLTATPASGYIFSQWGDGDTSATKSFTVTGDTSVTATFITEPSEYWTIQWDDEMSIGVYQDADPDEGIEGVDWTVESSRLSFNFECDGQQCTAISTPDPDGNIYYIGLQNEDTPPTDWVYNYDSVGWKKNTYKTIKMYINPYTIFTDDVHDGAWGDWRQFLDWNGTVTHHT